MTAPKPRKPAPAFDPAARYPQDYQQGVDRANRTIAKRPRSVDALLALVTRHMEEWPQAQKNALTDRQWARSAGFAHTLREYREEQGS